MKRRIFLSVLVIFVCLLTVGCGKEKKENNKESGSWENASKITAVLSNEAKEVFNKLDTKLKPIALLGKQVVAGTNYMYLCKDEDGYKVVVVYKELSGKVSITSTTKFNLTKYVSKDIDYVEQPATGGWNTEMIKDNKLDTKTQKVFESATETLAGSTYYPVAVLGTQVVAGTNYAVLAYGEMSVADENTGVYVLTLYEDLEGNSELTSIAYIDLAEFNK